ncbi:TasA family protein [Pseudarthrobacter sp. H2]|uniref:TasA family protein n=1 Tax=Pseudarthrobacter sp. H2 TaxID=3418415 RepID=UPI003CF141A8
MSAATTRPARRPRARLIAACAVAATGLAITGAGVYAALSATAVNTTAESVTSGTLSLTMANNGTGFSQAVSNLAPGDVVNRYITLTQGAVLDGKDITLAVADATPTLLTTNAIKGLHATVTQCSVAWVPGTGAGTCSGTPTVLLPSTPLSTLATAAAVKSGANAAGSVLNLQIALTLPDQAETTVNGVNSGPGVTIQGLTSALTWTFSETQRTATTTGS